MSELDPLLAAAYAADRRMIAALDLAGARERILLAASAHVAARAAATPRSRMRWARRGLALAASAAVGFGVGRATRRSPPVPVPVPVPVHVPVPVPVRVPIVAPEAAIAPADAAIDAGPVRRAAIEPRRADTAPLAEPLLIDQARAALRRGLAGEALDALERHRAQYPHGQLREDRDVLLIEVALAQDRLADANELLASYQQQYPHGGLQHRVEQLQAELDRRVGH